MPSILVVEPDALTRKLLLEVLRGDFDVTLAEDEPRALDAMRQCHDRFDLVIVEPYGRGSSPDFGFVRALRSLKIATPVLILSCVTGRADVVRGLGLGADDYLAKPFHPAELVARVHAVLRRSAPEPDHRVRVGDIAIDFASKRAFIADVEVHLTGKEYALLELLARRGGSVLSREAIMHHLYGGIDEPSIKIVDIFICHLRQKFRAGAAAIQSIRGRGYVLREPGTESPSEQAANRSLSALPHTLPNDALPHWRNRAPHAAAT
jgi:two-component system cell cycle response regulator CtrA